MKEHWQFVPIFLWLVGVMGEHSSVLAQTEPELNGPRAMLRLASVPRKLAAATPVAADTGAFPLAYCTALPSLEFGEWEKDYAKYERFLTPEIRKTQLGMGYTVGKVQTWWCRPSASPHAQLDTLTRLADPTKLEGRWKSILVRTVVHRDSAVFSESKFYRSARLIALDEQTEVVLAAGRITLLEQHGTTVAFEKLARKKYAVISGRYLLIYGLSKAGGAVTQVGFDQAGRLVLHNCAVTERKIRGQYITYQTVLNQAIFTRQP